jgi:hypothetical protein
MAYIINNYNTAQLTVVEDGTIDQTTDLKLVGKNYAGYGEIQNENFVFLLENFAGNNEPPKALIGQIWFDAGSNQLKYYDGAKWRLAGGSEVSETPPAGMVEGDFWWDSANDQLYCWNGTDYILVGPQGVGESVTRFQSRSIRDTAGVSRVVIVSVVDDEVLHIISTIDFTIAPEEAPNYPGFDYIHSGLTLKNTVNSTGGVTSTHHRWWGTASNSDRLGGFDVDKFVRLDGAAFPSKVGFGDDGLAVGNSDDLRLKIVNDNMAVIANEQGGNMFFQVRDISNNITMPLRLTADAILPGHGTPVPVVGTVASFDTSVRPVDIGSMTAPFQDVYGYAFRGVADSATALSLASTGGTIQAVASITAQANTIAARNATGDITANIFIGTATSARFADLAEYYTIDDEYEDGTVVSWGTDTEVTISTKDASPNVVGVISTSPAYLMNTSFEDYVGDDVKIAPIALKGRVPCKVTGTVNRGDCIISSAQPGVGRVKQPIDPATAIVIGRAIESSNNPEIKTIEIFV